MSSTSRGAVRSESDCYPTPKAAFQPLLPFLRATNAEWFWEPACGDGRLVRWMNEYGLQARGNDLQQGYNFLTDVLAVDNKYPCIVTNPPFSLALEFCKRALMNSPQVFMLLRLGFLASEERRKFWQQHPASALFILCKRPNFVMSVKCDGFPRTLADTIAPCGYKAMLPVDSVRQKNCPKCGGAVKISTSDSADYAWVYWGLAHKGIFWL